MAMLEESQLLLLGCHLPFSFYPWSRVILLLESWLAARVFSRHCCWSGCLSCLSLSLKADLAGGEPAIPGGLSSHLRP